ncbi:MAG: phosphatase PAP2 family protein, partial [Syntrophothermus sp.]
MAVKNIVGKSLYAALFNQMLPLLLIAWAVIAERNIKLPVIDSPVLGAFLTAAGLLLVGLGMFGIIKWGDGLPMNAYPPEKFVSRGIFRLIPHPVYSGAVISVAGVSILFRSAAGFWLVTPFLALGCIALVLGYEREDMQKRFGCTRKKCLVSFPDNTDEKAALWDFISVYVIVFLTWFVLYELVCLMGINGRSVSSFTSFELKIPVIEWTEIFYILTYPFVLLLPLTLRYKKELREFTFTGVAAVLTGIILQLAFPFIAPAKEFVSSGFWGDLIKFERSVDSAAAAFPSFHVIWAFTGAYFYSLRFGKKLLWYSSAVIISASCFTTGVHSLADILAGFITFLFVINIRAIASAGLRLSAVIANSWHEWDFGRI